MNQQAHIRWAREKRRRIVRRPLETSRDWICRTLITEPKRWVIAVLAFIGLMFGKMPPWLVVLACALAGKLFLH